MGERAGSPTSFSRSGGSPPTQAEYARLAREIAASEPTPGHLPLRVGFLGSCTLDFVQPFVLVEGARRQLHLRTYYGPFGQFEQQIADRTSALHAFDPEVLVLLMRPEDVDPGVYSRYYVDEHGAAALTKVVDRLVACVEGFRNHSSAPVLVANFAAPPHMPLGPLDANSADALTYALAAANTELRERAGEFPSTAIWDYAGLVRRAGTEAWSDPRMWAIARTPVASAQQPVLASHLSRTLSALVRPPAKCLVLDLDNTLWGGVIGDDGIDGIRLGDDFPGNVFKSFQRAVLGLADRGILLAIVSKNDAEVAEEAIERHPEMLIRTEHLAAARVNWEPKSKNLREIAKELNIGADALVLFDDNPVERAEVAANAPEVLVVDVPSDPLLYERALHDCGFFDTTSISREDRQRVQMYRQERARDLERRSAATVEEFLADLEMTAEVGTVDKSTLGRVAQLVGKTNQFNLTTRRHSQSEIAAMCEDGAHTLTYLRLRDRFGDLGLIAVGILAFQGDDAVIDSLVMSCRAMGRQAEVALAAELVRAARARGACRIIGEYIPTPKNHVVAELYPTLGFAEGGATRDGGTSFVLDLSSAALEWPSLIARTEGPNAIVTPA